MLSPTRIIAWFSCKFRVSHNVLRSHSLHSVFWLSYSTGTNLDINGKHGSANSPPPPLFFFFCYFSPIQRKSCFKQPAELPRLLSTLCSFLCIRFLLREHHRFHYFILKSPRFSPQNLRLNAVFHHELTSAHFYLDVLQLYHIYIFIFMLNILLLKVSPLAVVRMFMSPQNSNMEILTSNVMALGGEVFLGGDSVMNRISAL